MWRAGGVGGSRGGRGCCFTRSSCEGNDNTATGNLDNQEHPLRKTLWVHALCVAHSKDVLRIGACTRHATRRCKRHKALMCKSRHPTSLCGVNGLRHGAVDFATLNMLRYRKGKTGMIAKAGATKTSVEAQHPCFPRAHRHVLWVRLFDESWFS